MLLLWQGLYGVPPNTGVGYFSILGYWIGGGGSDGGPTPPASSDDWIIRFRRRRGR